MPQARSLLDMQKKKRKQTNKQTNKQTKIKKKKQVRNLKIIRNHMQDKAY